MLDILQISGDIPSCPSNCKTVCSKLAGYIQSSLKEAPAKTVFKESQKYGYTLLNLSWIKIEKLNSGLEN